VENAADGDPKTHAGFLATAMEILGPHGYKQVDHIEYDYIFMKH
jgi:hypothetical protein